DRPDNVHAVVDRARLTNSPDTSTNGFDAGLHWAYYCENGKRMSNGLFLQALKDVALTLSASTKGLRLAGGAIGAGVGACSVALYRITFSASYRGAQQRQQWQRLGGPRLQRWDGGDGERDCQVVKGMRT
ncbi:hypothetical protein FOZ60_008300, partial [Perkinsus olseni]